MSEQTTMSTPSILWVAEQATIPHPRCEHCELHAGNGGCDGEHPDIGECPDRRIPLQISVGADFAGPHNNHGIALQEPEPGDRYLLVYSYSLVGAGTPGAIWHDRDMYLGDVQQDTVPESLETWIRAHEETLREIAAGYKGADWHDGNLQGDWTEESQDLARGVADQLRDDTAYGLVARYWDAVDWMVDAADLQEIDDAGSIATYVANLVVASREDGAWVKADDLELVVREQLEDLRADLSEQLAEHDAADVSGRDALARGIDHVSTLLGGEG